MSILSNVLINGKKTYDDFNMILKSKVISAPEPDLHIVEVPCRNGSIDYSEVLTGKVAYKNRSITMNFLVTDIKFEDVSKYESLVLSNFHGRRVKISFDDDVGFYWLGRISVSVNHNSKNTLTSVEVNMIAEVDPYKYAYVVDDSTLISNPINVNNDTISLLNNIEVPKNSTNKNVYFFISNSESSSIPICVASDDGCTYVLGEMIRDEEDPEVESMDVISRGNLSKGNNVLNVSALNKNKEYGILLTNKTSKDVILNVNVNGGSL